MKINSVDDLELALGFRDLVSLGAGPQDLVYFFPSFFFGEGDTNISDSSIRVKSFRIYKIFSTDSVPTVPRRYRSIKTIMKDKMIKSDVESFRSFVLENMSSLGEDLDFSWEFVRLLGQYRSTCDNSLSFQDAFVVMKHVVFEKVL